MLPLLRYFVIGKYRLNRTFWLAGSTIDAFLGMNVELLVQLFDFCFVLSAQGEPFWRVNAIHRTDLDASGITDTFAWFCNDIWHIYS